MIIGIDTGLDGAIALIRDDGTLHSYFDTPTVSDGKRRFVDIYDIKRHIIPSKDTVIIEKAQSMPGNGGTAMFNYGVSYGMLLGMFEGLGISYHPVHPATWKSKMLKDMPKKGKDSSIIKVRQIYPDIALDRKKDHHIADAILLGLYGLKHIAYI